MFIYGPKGNPDATEKPKQYTLVPWETVSQEDKSNAQGGADPSRGPVAPSMPIGGWNLTSNDTVLSVLLFHPFDISAFSDGLRPLFLFPVAGSGDIFDEAAELSIQPIPPPY